MQAPWSVCHPHSSNIFSETTGPIKAKFHSGLVGRGNESLLHLGHMTKMATMPIYGKNPLKIFGTKEPLALGLGMQHWVHGPNEV